MRWLLTQGDILACKADVLICSANVFLTLSGGVGGEILRRHGSAMQVELQQYLRDHGRRFVERGQAVVTGGCGTLFRAVIHAVAVDGMYQSSSDIVAQTTRNALTAATSLQAQSVALTALATGYGRLSMREFARGIDQLHGIEWPPIQCVTIVVRNRHDADDIAQVCPKFDRGDGVEEQL